MGKDATPMRFGELLGSLRGGQKVRLCAAVTEGQRKVWTTCDVVSEFRKPQVWGYTYGWPVQDIRTDGADGVLVVEFTCSFNVNRAGL